MPIHSPGYRSWEGQREPAYTRSLVIASTGVKRASQSKWLRRLFFATVLPLLFVTVPLFIFEHAARDPTNAGRAIRSIIRDLPRHGRMERLRNVNLSTASPEEVSEVRHTVWSFLSLTLLRYPQALLMILLVGITAPPLIAHDVRSRAFLIYFSRPILRWEYILGKMGTVAFFLAMIIAIPTLLLYVAGVVLSPGFSVVLETWDLPIRIIVASIAVIIPTTAVALMLSSLTTESRYAGFGWFAIWILGYVTYGALSAFSAVNYNETSTDTAWQALFSPYHTLGIIQSWIFDLHLDTEPVVGAAILLVVVTIISLLVVYRRVSLPLRA